MRKEGEGYVKGTKPAGADHRIKTQIRLTYGMLLMTVFLWMAVLPADVTAADTVTAVDTETAADMVAEDMAAADTTATNITAEDMHRIYTFDEMMRLDWEQMSDEEKDEVVFYAADEDLQALLLAADGAKREAIAQTPYFSQITTSYIYSYDENGNALPDPQEIRMSYLDYLMQGQGSGLLKANWNTTGYMTITYQKKATGYYGGAPGGGASYDVKMKFTCDGKARDTTKTVTLSSVTGNNGAGFVPETGTYSLNQKSGGHKDIVYIPIMLSGLKGYVYTSNVGTPYDNSNLSEMVPGTGITGKEDSYRMIWHANLWSNSSLGSGGNATPGFNFVLSPAKNSISYAANGGTTTPASQVFGYFDGVNVSAAISRNPITYKVNFNPAGGQCAVSSLTSTRSFSFKNWKRSDGAVFTAGQKMYGFGENQASSVLTAEWTDSGQSSVTLPSAAKTGYVLEGWSGSGAIRKAGTAFVPQQNTSFTANWKANTYTVSFQTDGGDDVSPVSAIYDKAFLLPDTKKEGYLFKGWNGANLINQKGEVSNLTAEAGANVSLTAGWEPIKYTVSFDSRGGSSVEDVVCTYDMPFTLPVPQREDYEFAGWKDSEGNYVTVAQNMTSENAATVKLVAVWTVTTVTVHFDPKGGSVINTVKYTIGDSQPLPVPTKAGYLFKGWSDAAGKIYSGVQDIVSETGTLDLFAVWEEDKSAAGGNGGDHNITYQRGGDSYGLSEAQLQLILKALESGSVASLKIDGVEYSFFKNEDGSITIKLADCGQVEKLAIPGEIVIAGKTYPVTEIDKECFLNNKILKEVSLGSRITKIGDSAFSGCTNLEKIAFGEGLVTIGERAFYHCEKLKEVTFPKSLQSIGARAFEGCKSLKTVVLGEGILSVGKRAFYGCTSLVSLTIGKTVLTIGKSAFEACTSLRTVSREPGAALLKIGARTFAGDTALLKITLPDQLTTIPDKAFYQCKSLVTVKGGKGVTKVGAQSFEGCKQMKKITLYGKVQRIGKRAFYQCRKLRTVSIKSKGLISVGSKAFKKCAKRLKFGVPKNKSADYAKLMKGKY